LKKKKRFAHVTKADLASNESLSKIKDLNNYEKIKQRVTEIYIAHFNVGCQRMLSLGQSREIKAMISLE